MQMKRILGILLALCFLMSVTAAAVSAAEPKTKNMNDNFGKKNNFAENFGKKKEQKFEWKCKTVSKKERKLVKINTRHGHEYRYKWVTVHYKVCHKVPVHNYR